MSVRSTSVLTKKPIRSSSAPSVRPGDRAAERDVGPRAQPREQGRERRLQHHEQARPALARQRQQRTVQLGRERERHARRRDSSSPPGAAGRSAARSARAGRASASVQNASWRAMVLQVRLPGPARRAAGGCSRACAAAGAPAGRGGAVAAARRIGARRDHPQRAAPWTAVARNVVCRSSDGAALRMLEPSSNSCTRDGSAISAQPDRNRERTHVTRSIEEG